MSVLTQFVGGDRIAASLVCAAPQLLFSMNAVADAVNALKILSGAMTAGTLKPILSVSGRGQINWLGAYRANATSRSIRVRVTVDGVVIYDQTDVAAGSNNTGWAVVGAGASGLTSLFQPVRWRTGLLVEIADSITETDGIVVASHYEVHQ